MLVARGIGKYCVKTFVCKKFAFFLGKQLADKILERK